MTGTSYAIIDALALWPGSLAQLRCFFFGFDLQLKFIGQLHAV